MSDKEIKSWDEYFKKKDTVLAFYKEAFCVDGEVEFVKGRIKQEHCIKLTDSKRGVFYIASGRKLEDE